MSLKDLNLKSVYYSDEVTLLTEFYIPALSEAVRYDRIAGYFCSNTLAIAAKGVSEFIKNRGKIRLIANIIISKEDQAAIKEALKATERKVLLEIDEIEDQLKRNHIKMLTWMVKNNLLEIKIAVVNRGIEHQKIGILEDREGNMISFSGSENETVGGWLNNDEQFHVFCNWKKGDEEHLNPDRERFDILWEDKGKRVRVYRVSEAFKLGLIKNAPKNNEEFYRLTKEIIEELLRKKSNDISLISLGDKKEIKLRDYQLEAIEHWIANNYSGIFEMATGTGKTYAALGCLKEILKREKSLLTVISCPYQHLITQWERNIKDFEVPSEAIIIDGTVKRWKDKLVNNLYDLKNEVIPHLIILTTHNTFSNKSFYKNMEMIKSKSFVIVDEVHGIGAEIRKEGLLSVYEFRLGLSATPERWFDEIGTKTIRDFFGKTVFEFSLKDAIKKGYLTKYNYKPLFVQLTDKELEEYEKQTSKIAKSLVFSKKDIEKEKLFTLLCIQRQKIIINSKNKILVFSDLLKKLEKISHCLIYCSPQQIDQVQQILNTNNVIQHRFTNEEGTSPESRLGGLSQRDFLLKEFADEVYPVLVAMKCLDEGVDVPPARMAIILASSGNPKEYIQRRGRILRPFRGKKKAIIYDLIVAPPITKITNHNLLEIEKRILEKELIRYKEFADASDNRLECLNNLYKFYKEHNIQNG